MTKLVNLNWIRELRIILMYEMKEYAMDDAFPKVPLVEASKLVGRSNFQRTLYLNIMEQHGFPFSQKLDMNIILN